MSHIPTEVVMVSGLKSNPASPPSFGASPPEVVVVVVVVVVGVGVVDVGDASDWIGIWT